LAVYFYIFILNVWEKLTKKKFSIEKENSGFRVDKYLGDKLAPDFSRVEIKNFIKKKYILINNAAIKPHYKLKENDSIVIDLPQRIEQSFDLPATEIALDIVYEDEDLIVVNKSAGMVVHPGAGHFSDTLVNALLYYTSGLSDLNGILRPGIVHRLDKDTSGLIVIAKHNQAHRFLASQFKEHKVKKTYIAVVKGRVEYDQGIIDAPIQRSPVNRKKMAVSYACTKQAITCYSVLKRTEKFSVLKINLKTGRTHQIRVHLAHLGHPVLGDSLYSRNATNQFIQRQALHAQELGFFHPQTNKFIEFFADLPDDMQCFKKGAKKEGASLYLTACSLNATDSKDKKSNNQLKFL